MGGLNPPEVVKGPRTGTLPLGGPHSSSPRGGGRVSDLTCRLCGARADRDVRRPGHVSAVRELRARDAARDDGAVLPAPRPGLLLVPARPAAEPDRRRRDLQPLRVLLLVQRLLGGARPPVRRRCRLPARSRPATRSWSRSPATTGTCCSTSWRRASGASASSRPATSPRPPWRGACRPRSRSSVRRPGATSPAGTVRPTSSRPTTCSPTCPTSSTSARACARCSGRRRLT